MKNTAARSQIARNQVAYQELLKKPTVSLRQIRNKMCMLSVVSINPYYHKHLKWFVTKYATFTSTSIRWHHNWKVAVGWAYGFCSKNASSSVSFNSWVQPVSKFPVGQMQANVGTPEGHFAQIMLLNGNHCAGQSVFAAKSNIRLFNVLHVMKSNHIKHVNSTHGYWITNKTTVFKCQL